MKKFKFKLESYLKLKIFDEYKIKLKLGEINQKIFKTQSKIEDLNSQLISTYAQFSTLIESGIQGRMAHAFPDLVSGIKAHILQTQLELKTYQHEYQITLKELNIAKGKIKILEKLKKREKDKYLKKYHLYQEKLLDEMNSVIERYKEGL